MPPDRFTDRLRHVIPLPESPEPPPPQPAPQKPATLPREHPFEPEMILIPAGDFLMGSDPTKDKFAGDNEQPQHILHLPDYYMASTLVTNAQYTTFVHATAHHHPEHWNKGQPPDGKEDHPVVHVSWHDAVDYCKWLSQVTGRPYRLPSEAEWEKGARGPDGRIYPWGDEWDPRRCNNVETDLSIFLDTTPVGAYAEGASPYGLLDMAGNVFEWTRSLYRDYPYNPADGREDMNVLDRWVIRGGAFRSDRSYLRSARRYGHYPNFQAETFGFRVAADPV
jgi:formylglycine-generating enzyme required for sulfatase activity